MQRKNSKSFLLHHSTTTCCSPNRNYYLSTTTCSTPASIYIPTDLRRWPKLTVSSIEAHPFLLHNLKAGSDKFWTDKGDPNLGIRAGGTDAQLWLRYDLRTSGSYKT
jgi:hypothetical protein